MPDEIKDENQEMKPTSAAESIQESTARSLFDFFEMFVIAMAAILLLFSFFVRQTVVDGNSMQKTLENGERLLVSDLFYTPVAGDIIVFQSSATGRPYPLVKRIIAVAGDRVRIEASGVYVNDKLLDEPYTYTSDPFYYYSSKHYIELGQTYTVPDGALFVLGDHRDDSSDSRHFGFIDEADVLGRVIFRLTPFDRFGTVK